MYTLLIALFTGLSLDTVPPDGPYLFYDEDGQVIARWVDTEKRTQGSMHFKEENFDQLPDFPTFRPDLVDVDRDWTPEPQLHFKGVKKVAAISDVHGQFHTGAKLLQAQGIIDEDLNWTFGEGHLVIVGDIFDRGDQVTEMLWLVHNLQIQSRQAGGRVHFLLGNHETMVLKGDDRYVHKKYRITSSMTQKFYKELFGTDTYLGRWLRSLPLAISINNDVYVHGGLGREVVREVHSLGKLNELYRQGILQASELDVAKDENPRLNLLEGRDGPLWYRGYFVDKDFSDRDIRYILKKLGANRIIVGHTSFTAIKSYYEDRIIAVDSSIKFGSIGELLLIEDGKFMRGTIDGKRLALEQDSR